MKPYIRVLTSMPVSATAKAAIIGAFAPTPVRICDIEKADQYRDDELCAKVVEFDGEEFNEAAPVDVPVEPTEESEEPEEPETMPEEEPEEELEESESEHCEGEANHGQNKHGQNLELVKQFVEKFGKPPHHKAKDASIIEALSNEAND